MDRKAFVLLSGGLDSTTCLFQAIQDLKPEFVMSDREGTYWVEAVSINYGQRHKRELVQAAKICKEFGVKHTILDVGDLLKGKEILLSADSMDSMEMVHKSYDQIEGVSPSYVPFRNGLLLSAITAHAQKYVNSEIAKFAKRLKEEYSWEEDEARKYTTEQAKDLVTIYYGAHAEDAANWAYPDCTPEFNGSMANAIYTGSYNTIRLATPLQWMHKHEIVSKGDKLGAPLELTWSCYDAGEIHCGECPTCIARKEAFEKADVQDPTEYAK
jgi:7-cyano-7-deazaguanine synthase